MKFVAGFLVLAAAGCAVSGVDPNDPFLEEEAALSSDSSAVYTVPNFSTAEEVLQYMLQKSVERQEYTALWQHADSCRVEIAAIRFWLAGRMASDRFTNPRSTLGWDKQIADVSRCSTPLLENVGRLDEALRQADPTLCTRLKWVDGLALVDGKSRLDGLTVMRLGSYGEKVFSSAPSPLGPTSSLVDALVALGNNDNVLHFSNCEACYSDADCMGGARCDGHPAPTAPYGCKAGEVCKGECVGQAYTPAAPLPKPSSFVTPLHDGDVGTCFQSCSRTAMAYGCSTWRVTSRPGTPNRPTYKNECYCDRS